MNITFLGTGVAIPQTDRVQSGIIAEIEGKPILFDCGSGILNRIFESRYNHTDIDTVVLSHLHLDHVADVLCLIKANWLCDKTNITIYGPEGTNEWMTGLLKIYGYLQGKSDTNIIEVSAGDTFTPDGVNCKITCSKGVHSVPSLGYRIESGGSTIVYSGDTEPCKSIMDLSQDADLLIHECSFPCGFEVTYHTTPDMLDGYINYYNTNVSCLYLTHLYPQMQGHEQESIEYLKNNLKIVQGIEIATDLMKIKV
ncbi:beta-lactamase-like protein [Methanohalobium evestigatum Z-7303]|uniref:Beta-lactamase-like protein n=1 Tax=Methanohalobium evestigatum (strain ATCC BAA-1072 / DSM 3721 / NBRC 107634 / OCM 161 / Z-7303) TaxID=644295 RepID=D7E918_METEZ|nr:MBL fold metallo-hydrolase [Methanohalobium evestigatum]ADI73966.1 beta-lactamase-like protein [Methanohalobium evestigatum Z-7303]